MAHTQFGIDEIYFHNNLDYNLLKKLQQRADLFLDGEDNIVRIHVGTDMILVFYKRVPSQTLIYSFLKFFHKMPGKENYIQENTLLNEDELFAAIKSQKFAFITHRSLTTA